MAIVQSAAVTCRIMVHWKVWTKEKVTKAKEGTKIIKVIIQKQVFFFFLTMNYNKDENCTEPRRCSSECHLDSNQPHYN